MCRELCLQRCPRGVFGAYLTKNISTTKTPKHDIVWKKAFDSIVDGMLHFAANSTEYLELITLDRQEMEKVARRHIKNHNGATRINDRHASEFNRHYAKYMQEDKLPESWADASQAHYLSLHPYEDGVRVFKKPHTGPGVEVPRSKSGRARKNLPVDEEREDSDEERAIENDGNPVETQERATFEALATRDNTMQHKPAPVSVN
jgi:hypothetical protein